MVLKEKNIGIYQPKKDQCNKCYEYKVKNISDEEYKIHVAKKDMARLVKNTDKKRALSGEIHMFCMDLQAVKLCPALKSNNGIYYKTKLANHNFTMYNMATKQVTCYWFSEIDADLSSSTFANLISHHLTNILKVKKLPIVLFSNDYCYQKCFIKSVYKTWVFNRAKVSRGWTHSDGV